MYTFGQKEPNVNTQHIYCNCDVRKDVNTITLHLQQYQPVCTDLAEQQINGTRNATRKQSGRNLAEKGI